MIRVVFLAVLAALFASTGAHAQTGCATFEFVGTNPSIAYNPFTPQDSVYTFSIKATRASTSTQSVRFILLDETPSPTGARIGPNGPGQYDIRWLTDTSRVVFGALSQSVNDNNAAVIAFGNGNGNNVAVSSFQIIIPRGQSVIAGNHLETLVVRYQCRTGNNWSAEAEQRSGSSQISARVPQYAAAYVGSVGQTRGTIAFGPLSASSPLTRSVGVTAMSTVPYEVAFRSERAGLLKRTLNDTSGIAYSLRYAGRQVRSGDRIVCPVTPMPIGKIDELQVTLDTTSIATLPAGDYSDTITLTFSPRDGAATLPCV